MRRRPETFKGLAEELAKDSIVTSALQRFIEEIIQEAHEYAVAPRNKVIRQLLRKPNGCIYCDQGRLIRPTGEHDDDCGFHLAATLGFTGE